MRVQVNISDELVKKIDDYAKMMGVSRSALCSVWIGQSVMSYDKSLMMIEQMGDKIGDRLLTEKVIKEEAAKLFDKD